MFFEPIRNLPTNQRAETQIDPPWRLCDSQYYNIIRRFMNLFCNVTRQISILYLLPFLKPKCDLRNGQH